MYQINRRPRPSFKFRAHRGQSLIIALAVLFVMLILGAIFITQIARNLTSAARNRDTQAAKVFAESGIRFCDDNLTRGEDGADWRPAPTAPIFNAADPMGVTDPDYLWLRPQPDGTPGFTRISYTGGRALVRVLYDPHPDDPQSQYIRIESVGRSGDVGNGDDPTLFVQRGNMPRLRSEMAALKQIGLTDYLMFNTGKDKRSLESFIGVPAIGPNVAMSFGDPSLVTHPDGTNGNELIIGGGIRTNGNCSIGGDTFFYFSPRGTTLGGLTNVSPEGLLSSGSILLRPTRNLDNGDANADPLLNNNDLQSYFNQPIGNPSVAGAIRASEDPQFNSFQGMVRDGSTSADVFGHSRSIPRLDPPLWDTFVDGSGVLRYRALTRDSGFWVNATYNTGFNGFGRGIYINNSNDLQPETQLSGVSGGYSLRADWLDPHNSFTHPLGSGWNGPHYRAPGLSIQLLGNVIILTRDDGQNFTKPDGTPINGAAGTGGNVMVIPLTNSDRQQFRFPDGTLYTAVTGGVQLPQLPHDGDEAGDATKPFNDKNSYGVNVVLMAEGNVRIKGVYGAVTDPTIVTEDPSDPTKLKLGRVHLTIVTGGTAYIEGNIVKGDGYRDASGTHLERGSTCAILAKDYVCVNTTMFMSPQNQTNVWSRNPEDQDAFQTEVGLTRPTYDSSFSFGVPPDSYKTGGNATDIYMLIRHTSQVDSKGQGFAPINLLVNPGQNGNTLYPFNQFPGTLPPETYPLGKRLITLPNNGAIVAVDDPSQVAQRFEKLAVKFNSALTPTINVSPGFENFLRFQIDPNAGTLRDVNGQLLLGGTGSTDYLFGNAMMTPLDIRIEALVYAQEKSFFIIPGYSFNPDPNDSKQKFLERGNIRTSYGDRDTPGDRAAKDMFPYYNSPMDVRITICGSIVQNYTASAGDQALWMSRWGYIPIFHGSTNDSGNPMPVPDDHMLVHDATDAAVTYNPAEDRTGDYRSAQEKQESITRGIRFLYDPSFAMPYQHPTGADLLFSTYGLREARALRFVQRPAIFNNLNQMVSPAVRQILPPMPRLPVCPGLLYFGDSDRTIGSQ